MTARPHHETISATIVVYNEEARIERVLQSLAWCDEIVVIDKSSTDRTREIAARYTNRIVVVPYTDFAADELRAMIEHCSSEWILWCTASRLVPRAAAETIRAIVRDPHFPYDVLNVPFQRYVLGLAEPWSPWFSTRNKLVFRKSVASVREDDVHGALALPNDRVYDVPLPRERGAEFLHLTHESVDSMLEHHIRYCRSEAALAGDRVSLRAAARDVLRAVIDVLFRLRTIWHGADGRALSFAWISYWMLRYLYFWERKRSKAAATYRRIEEEIVRDWETR